VAIIGAGLAGLTAAHYLREAGVNAELYEAAGRLGGRVLSRQGGVGAGLVIELGAEFINSDHADMLALVERFGVGPLFDRKRDARRTPEVPAAAYFLDGGLLPEARLARLLRPLAAQIGDDAALLDADFDGNAPALDALSVNQYLDRHAGLIRAPFIRTLIEQTIRTEYGVEPERSSALQLLFNLPSVEGEAVELLASDERFTIPGGNGRLIEAMAAALPGRIHTRRQLLAVERAEAGAYRLVFASGGTAIADRVIITIPFTILRGVAFRVPLSARVERSIAAGELGANEKIVAGFKRRVWRRPAGFSGEIWSDERYSEAWDATTRQPDAGEAALTFYLGGRQVRAFEAPAAVEGPKLVARLDAAIPGLAEAANGRFLRTRWERNPFALGAYSSFPPGAFTGDSYVAWAEGPRRVKSEVRSGDIWFAGEHLSDAYYGFMNGAAETGRLAARSLLEQLVEDARDG
jgi:monoamine oxidase